MTLAVTVVATPLGITAAILEQLRAHGRRGLVFDIGSLKSPLVRAEALRVAGALVTSVHPMFGPDTSCSRAATSSQWTRPRRRRSRSAELFASTMAQQMEMTLEEHDRLIAYVLGLSHALNIAFFTALAESGERRRASRICRARPSMPSSGSLRRWRARERNSTTRSRR